jgi:hypothetical protein
MKGRKLEEHLAVSCLNRKKGVQITDKYIFVQTEHECGNKSWGMIDYLTHYCGYFAQWRTKENKGAMIHRNLVQ